MGIEILPQYLLRITPGCVLGAIFLALLPRSARPWRIVTYLLLFVLVRDAMTPMGLWQIDLARGTLRLPSDPALLLALAAISGALVIGIHRWEPSLAPLVIWRRGSVGAGLAYGVLGCLVVSALPFVSHRLSGATSGPPVAPALVAPLLAFALVGNLLEEFLFRGHVQGLFEESVGAIRAALLSGVLFAFCHVYLATTVTNAGVGALVFTLAEGLVAGLVRARSGVLPAAVTHGGAIFLLAAGWV